MADEIIEALEEVEAELFPPKPGGLVDRHRKRKALEAEKLNADEPVEERAYRAVKVAPESPESVAAMTYYVPAGGVVQVLPLSMYRHRATLLSATAGASLSAVRDQGAGLGAVNAAVDGTQGAAPGFYLPPSVPVVTFARGQLWVANLGSTAAYVSVLSEFYAPEGS